jgi:hypothetical protein
MCMVEGVCKSVKFRPHMHIKGWGPIMKTSKWFVVCGLLE